MKNSHISQEQLINILDVARLAPSAHNTQPWKVLCKGNKLIITVDPDHVLNDGDPTGRQTILGLGIFLEALIIGVNHIGMSANDIKYISNNKSVELKLEPNKKGHAASDNTESDVAALRKRCTDRSVYEPVKIPQKLITTLKKLSNKRIQISIVQNRDHINKIAELTAKGVALALGSPGFRKELSQYLVLPRSKKNRGISVKSLYIPWILAYTQKTTMNFKVFRKVEFMLEKKRGESASAVILISAAGDMPEHWLEAGRLYLKISLEIEKSGLSQTTSASIAEASDFHQDIEELTGLDGRILSVLRIGKGSRRKYYSPRVPASELLHRSN